MTRCVAGAFLRWIVPEVVCWIQGHMGSQVFRRGNRGAWIYMFPSNVWLAVLFDIDYDKYLRVRNERVDK